MKIIGVTLLAALLVPYFGCTSQRLGDAAITAKVKARLAKDKNTSAIKISVETHGGRVILTGVVPTELEKSRAGQVAKSTEGVRRIVNNITVDPHAIGATNIRARVGAATERAKGDVSQVAESASEAVADAAVLAKIKAQLVTQGITGTDVAVKNGDVVIKGAVANAQEKAKAERIARGTQGVRGVRNQLQIKRS